MTRLVPRSIAGRMLALSAGATVLALIIAGIFITGILERFVTQGVDQRLDAQISLLASTVGNDGGIDGARLDTLKGALNAGRGWQWRIDSPTGRYGSDDAPSLDPGPDSHRRDDRRGIEAPYPREGRDVAGRPVHARQLKLDVQTGTIVITAIAPRAVIERPIRGAMAPLLIGLALLGGVLATSSVLQILHGLRPLRRLRDDVAAIRADRQRSVSEEQPEDLRPLASELNALMRDNAAALAAARASAANLAHALKTPVAALALEVQENPAQARQVDRIDATIRHHLSRARDRIVDRHAATLLAPAAKDLAVTVARLHPDKSVTIAVEIDAELAVAVDPADLDEMLGNLIDNAVRHAHSGVTATARRDGQSLRISVADDGPGIAPEDRERALSPGVRLDERGNGHGFGLSIGRELAELYGGVLNLSDAANGGVVAEVTLPKAAPIQRN